MYNTWLIPYLDGALAAPQWEELEARLADDPALAAELSALRRSLPALRIRLAPRETPDGAPLWPHLQGRLAHTSRRHVRPAFLGCAVGLAVAAALLCLGAQDRHATYLQAGRSSAQWQRELSHAPLVSSHPDDAPTRYTAACLESRARRVAAERQAAEFPPRAVVASRDHRSTPKVLTF